MLFHLVLVPILIAVLLYLFPSSRIARILVVISQAAMVYFSVNLFSITRETAVVAAMGNFRGGLGILLKADSLSSVFIVITTFVFFTAAIYSFYENNDKLFWFLLFVWEGLLLGIFLTNDLFNIFVLVEVATVVVAVLIMFYRGSRSMYDGMVYLMINVVVIQFYLFGLGYLYKLTGALDIDMVGEAAKTLDRSSLILPYALIMTAVSLKCAFIPLYSWLPRAHGTPGAPSSVSAILSGLHIKGGLYLFIRFQTLFSDAALPEFFIVVGIITGIGGFVKALSQSDIKRILAFSTISQIGLITIGLNIADTYTFTGSLYHIFNHSMFKSALFLSAGMISHVYGTRNIDKIRGLFRVNPMVGSATIMAIFGITGVPMFNGSISKYFMVSGTNWLVSAAIIFINLGTITVFIRYSMMLFGQPEVKSKAVHTAVYQNDRRKVDRRRVDSFRQISVFLLGVLCFISGIFGEDFIQLLFNIQVSVDPAGFLEKAALFGGSLIAGLLIVKYYVPESTLLKRINAADLNFRGMCISIGVFFAVILITLNVFPS